MGRRIHLPQLSPGNYIPINKKPDRLKYKRLKIYFRGRVSILTIYFCFQKDVIAESIEILELGLLFGEDVDAITTDLPEVLSFQHKLIQEYLAAVYIADNINQGTHDAFLAETFPTWDVIQNQREVVRFASGILATTDANPLTNHVGKVLGEYISNQLNTEGHLPSGNFQFVSSLQKEGDVSLINPYLTKYPACGRPLAEVLANTKLLYITDIDDNDPLQLNSCPAQIVVEISGRIWRRFSSERLWQALQTVPTNIIALSLCEVESAKRMKLGQFSQLKHLNIEPNGSVEMSELGDLAESIESWGSQPPLLFCSISKPPHTISGRPGPLMPPPRSLVKALSRCIHLRHLNLSSCNLHDKLSILMVSPSTRKLIIYIIALFESYNDPRTSTLGTDFIDTILN